MHTMDNVVLIGMPGAGKSTVGVVLAKRLGYRFVDSDLVIQEQENMLLHQIIEEKGLAGFLEVENKANAKNVNAIFGMTFVICGPFFYLTNVIIKDMTSGNRQIPAIFLQ